MARRVRLEGFTLIELMIVVSIIAILASIVVPKFADLVRKSKEAQSKGSLGSLRSAVNIYYSDMEGQFPIYFDAMTVSGKYLSNIPMLRLPDYHPDLVGPGVAGNINVCAPLPCDTIGFAASSGELILWHPQWYIGNLSAVANADNANVGVMWITCSHTDSKGTVWTSY
jgi:prepilin-type N-terminal cleavage/methylation domain-containing protein